MLEQTGKNESAIPATVSLVEDSTPTSKSQVSAEQESFLVIINFQNNTF